MGANDNNLCVILGGGGHARVLIDSVQASGAAKLYGILDPDRSLWGKDLMGVPVLGGDDLLRQLSQEGITEFVVGLGSIGDNQPRRRLFELGVAHRLMPITVCHPSAVRSPTAGVGAGSVLFPNAVVNAGAILGVNVIVNTGAIVEHDCVLGDHVHVATGACLCSAVHVGNGAHIGAGATVRQCVSIGGGAIIGAGAVIVKDVEPHTVVVGVPARVLKRLETDASPKFLNHKRA